MVDRMRRGAAGDRRPGDGTSLWTMTWNRDFAKGFVGLLGQRRSAIGHAFHITSDEVLTWDQIYRRIGRARAGAEPRHRAHRRRTSSPRCTPRSTGSLLGDKAHSAVFDNTKIRRFVPDFVGHGALGRGRAPEPCAWFETIPTRCTIDEAFNALCDRIVEANEPQSAPVRRPRDRRSNPVTGPSPRRAP